MPHDMTAQNRERFGALTGALQQHGEPRRSPEQSQCEYFTTTLSLINKTSKQLEKLETNPPDAAMPRSAQAPALANFPADSSLNKSHSFSASKLFRAKTCDPLPLERGKDHRWILNF